MLINDDPTKLLLSRQIRNYNFLVCLTTNFICEISKIGNFFYTECLSLNDCIKKH